MFVSSRASCAYQCHVYRTKQHHRPRQDPDVIGAAHSRKEAVLLRGHVALKVPVPGEVPFLLPALSDGVAVHCRLEVGGNKAVERKTDLQLRIEWLNMRVRKDYLWDFAVYTIANFMTF